MNARAAGILAAGLLLTTGWLGCQPAAGGSQPRAHVNESQAGARGNVLPAFTVKTLEGEEQSLEAFRGRVVILDLFATWCPPCRQEIPHFIELQREHPKDLAVVGLSFDQAPVKTIRAFVEDMHINYPVFLGTEEIARYVGLRGIPHTLVLDREGRVVKTLVGYQDKSVFENLIRPLLTADPS